MKFSKTIPITLILTCIVLLTLGQGGFAETLKNKTTTADVKKEVQDLMTALKGYTADQREEAVTKTKVALEHLDQHIDELERDIDAEWDKMSKTARKQARANLKILREERVKLAEWTGRLKGSSTEAWEHVKKGFSESYDTLHESWQKAMKSFDSEK